MPPPEHDMVLRHATSADGQAVARIYNHYVAETIVTFEEEAVSPREMGRRIEEVQAASLPWLVAEVDGGIAGFAYASKWKGRCAYRHSAEVTVYLDPGYAGRGIGIRMGRYAGRPFPAESLDQELYTDFEELRVQRKRTDRDIVEWVDMLRGEDLSGEPSYPESYQAVPSSFQAKVFMGPLVIGGVELLFWFRFFAHERRGSRIFAAMMGFFILTLVLVALLTEHSDGSIGQRYFWFHVFVGVTHVSYAFVAKEQS